MTDDQVRAFVQAVISEFNRRCRSLSKKDYRGRIVSLRIQMRDELAMLADAAESD